MNNSSSRRERAGLFDDQFASDVKLNLEAFFDGILEDVTLYVTDNQINDPITDGFNNHLEKIKNKVSGSRDRIIKEVDKNKEYLIERVLGINYIDYSSDINNFEKNNLDLHSLLNLYDNKLEKLFDYHEKWLERIQYIKERESLRFELKKEINNIKAAKLAIESNKADEIFLELSNKYEDEYELNNEYFRNSFIVTICCTLLSIIYTINIAPEKINWTVFISVKVLIIAVGITLCTLFLRRSAHAKKLHEKSYQTHVEINAYPIFINSLKEEDKQEITKELALRYFGNNSDQTQNDKIGDLFQDQLSAGTELIRASAEMVKLKSESDGNK